MIVFVGTSFLGKRLGDRLMMLVGLVCNMFTLVLLILLVPHLVPLRNSATDFALFLVPVVINIFSLPLVVLSSISLLSSITSIHSQGLTQGIRRTFVGTANILGPNLAGTFFNSLQALFITLIGLEAIGLIMIFLSFKYLK